MKWLKTIGWICAGLVLIALILDNLFSKASVSLGGSPKTLAKNDELQLMNAIKGFYTEYGRLPKTSAECVPADGKLMSILIGRNQQENPRKIVFIEVPNAKDGIWKNGLHPETGTWMDPYGHPYLVKFDTDYDGFIYNPYTDPAAGNHKISSIVIVWSPGTDGIFGKPQHSRQFQGSGDILSWQ